MVEEFLRHSNAIERVYDEDSLQQALYAWEYLAKQEYITHEVIKRTHKLLMLHQPLMPNEKGYYRKIPVYVGCKQIPFVNIETDLDDWIDDMNIDPKIFKDKSEKAMEDYMQALHVHYERIHPFVDGNGRTGRMFMNWHRLRNGYPIMVIREEDKFDYYKWFSKKK